MITKEKIDLKGLVRRETLIQRNYSTVAFYLSVGWFLLVLQSNECFVFFVFVKGGEFLMIEVKSSGYPNCTDESDCIRMIFTWKEKRGVSWAIILD